MVGVPGRSKACSTCRRRKKGCDFQRPACGNCMRAGLSCGGYERNRIFVNATQQNPIASSSARQRGTSTASPVSPVNVSELDLRDREKLEVVVSLGAARRLEEGQGHPNATSASNSLPVGVYVSNDYCSGYVSSFGSSYGYRDIDNIDDDDNGDVLCDVPNRCGSVQSRSSGTRQGRRAVPAAWRASAGAWLPAPNALSGNLNNAAREGVMLARFWESYLPNSSVIPDHAGYFGNAGWTNVVLSLYHEDRALHYSLIANSMTAIAWTNNSRALSEQSIRAHGRALWEVRTALSDEKRAKSDGVLAALRMMVLFSIIFMDRNDKDRSARACAWREHNAGMRALYLLRGPHAHINGHGHQMFVDARSQIIIHSLLNRKASPFSNRDWMTVPWREIPKTPKDLLMDIASVLPTIFEDIDQYLALPKDDPVRVPLHQRLAISCVNSDIQLTAWYNTHAPIGYQPPSEIVDGFQSSVEDIAFTYSALLCFTFSLLVTVNAKLISVQVPSNMTMAQHIRRIVHYTGFYLMPNIGFYGSEALSIPLGTCFKLFHDNPSAREQMPEEFAMLKNLIATKRGREVFDFIQSLMQMTDEAEEIWNI